MAFTSEQLEKGVAFLKEYIFFELFCDFKIPEKWHKLKEVDEIDEFTMYKTDMTGIGFKNQNIEDKNDQFDMTHSLIEEVFGSTTCKTYAQYLYALIVHVHEVNKKELVQMDKDFEELVKENEATEATDKLVEEYFTDIDSNKENVNYNYFEGGEHGEHGEYQEYERIKLAVIELIKKGKKICLFGDQNNGKTFLQYELDETLKSNGYCNVIPDFSNDLEKIKILPDKNIISVYNIDKNIMKDYCIIDMNHLHKGKLKK